MGTGYQERDYEIVDYELYELPGIKRFFRGPKPSTLEPRRYFACVGAAQTFGCYCPKPFPALLSERISFPVLNLGVAGAGPVFFLERAPFIHHVNGARFAIIQVMSGRSERNSVFDTGGGELLRRRSDGQVIAAALAYRELLQNCSRAEVDAIVTETRKNWVAHTTELLGSITVPKILFWFSTRHPEYTLDYADERVLFGAFPQFVNREMIDAIRPHADDYVEVVTSRGFPQPLFSRFTGEPATIRMRADLGGRLKTHNDYYPSPEMQLDAADALEATCRRVFEATGE